MSRVIEYIQKVPEYLSIEFTTHTLAAVIVLAVFLYVLFFSNKAAEILRKIFIAACVIFAAAGGFNGPKNYGFQMICTAIIALVILAIVRTVRNAIVTVRQNRINARIEERALAKAAKRRGSFKNKQGYSGEAKPIVDDYVPGKMSKDEINDVIENEVVGTSPVSSENEAPAPEETLPVQEEAPPVPEEAPAAEDSAAVPPETPPEEESSSDGPAAEGAAISKDEVYDALAKLGDLKDKGILTEEEFAAKKAELLAKIG